MRRAAAPHQHHTLPDQVLPDLTARPRATYRTIFLKHFHMSNNVPGRALHLRLQTRRRSSWAINPPQNYFYGPAIHWTFGASRHRTTVGPQSTVCDPSVCAAHSSWSSPNTAIGAVCNDLPTLTVSLRFQDAHGAVKGRHTSADRRCHRESRVRLGLRMAGGGGTLF
jgi:hypothetical protein